MAQSAAFTLNAQQPGGEDHRAAPRRRVLLKGLVSLDGLFSAEPCTVRNISDTGAMIIFEHPAVVPTRFTLIIDLLGFKVLCEQVWQKGLTFGVRFASAREETSFRRRQVLSTSENALSKSATRQIDMSAPVYIAPEEPEAPEPEREAEKQKNVPRPIFGKRNWPQ